MSSNAIGFDKSTFYPFEIFGEAHAAVSAPNKISNDKHRQGGLQARMENFYLTRSNTVYGFIQVYCEKTRGGSGIWRCYGLTIVCSRYNKTGVF
jgi:hypothetical protein